VDLRGIEPLTSALRSREPERPTKTDDDLRDGASARDDVDRPPSPSAWADAVPGSVATLPARARVRLLDVVRAADAAIVRGELPQARSLLAALAATLEGAQEARADEGDEAAGGEP
jgi:hypothetical protein